MAKKKPRPPTHLRLSTRRWWQSVLKEYELEEHHVRLLTLACEAWDRGVEAREALTEHGLTFDDRFGSPHSRPEVAVERDCRIGFARLVRELGFDISEPMEPRPPNIQGNADLKVSEG